MTSPSIAADALGVVLALVTIPLGIYFGLGLSKESASLFRGAFGRLFRWGLLLIAAVVIGVVVSLPFDHVKFNKQNPPWAFGLLDGGFLGLSLGAMYGLFKLQRVEVERKWKPNPLLFLDWGFAALCYLAILGDGLTLTKNARPVIAHHLSSVSPGVRSAFVVGGVFAVTFVYSHLVTGGILNGIVNGINLDWDLSRNRLYVLAILPPVIAIPLLFPYPGAIVGIGLRTLVLLVAWKWTRNQPSGLITTTKSLLTRRSAAPTDGEVPDGEWCSRDLATRLLNEARLGYAEIAFKSDRLVTVKNRDGKTGYYRYAVDREVKRAKSAGSQAVRMRELTDRLKRF